MKLFSRRNLILVLVLLGVVIGLYVRTRVGSSVATAKVARATVGDLIQTFRTNGVVEPVQFQEIHAEFPARVAAVLVHQGDRVHAGQSLARLDSEDTRIELARARSNLLEAEQALAKVESDNRLSELDAQIAQAKTELALAESNHRRDATLLSQKAISQLEFDESSAAYEKASQHVAALEGERQVQTERLAGISEESARARVAEARVRLAAAEARVKAAEVPAPLSGTVLIEPPRAGTPVNPGDVLAKVGDTSRLQVRAFIDQPDFSSIQPGSPVRITSNGFPGEAWQGNVTSLSAQLTTLGKRVVGEALCSVEDGRDPLPVNSNVDLTFTSRELHDVLLVPVDAVLQKDNRNYVYAVEAGILRLQEVETGASNADSVVIRSGLKLNQMVLNDLEVQPREGMRVEPR
ncbi:MAG TPA: efflux RND transporter periplasmic adaptor subunit [Terriglobia bacterium]|nr:efflux RND transporter periplasmic adaptor subunit [Terriglobia bacterium]